MRILIILIVFFSQNVFAKLALANKEYETKPIVIAVMGDGYGYGEQEAFKTHADHLIDELLEVEPFKTYADFFDFKLIEAISWDSGVSNDPAHGVKKNTLFNVRFAGRSMRVDSEAVISQMPQAKYYIVLANSDLYGGATYMKSNIVILPGFSTYSAKILVHEMGHLVGRLADEYIYTDKTYTEGEPKEENLTIQSYDQMLQSNTKWGRWLGYPGIDLFEGGDNYRYGIFRPTFKSNMNSYDYGFSVVNKEQLIKEIHKETGIINKCTAVGNRALIYPKKEGSVNIIWFIDDQRVEGVGHYLDVDRSGVIKALVTDDTQDVRDERFRDSNMTNECIWDSHQGGGGSIDVKFLLLCILIAFGPTLFNMVSYYFVKWLHTEYNGKKD